MYTVQQGINSTQCTWPYLAHSLRITPLDTTFLNAAACAPHTQTRQDTHTRAAEGQGVRVGARVHTWLARDAATSAVTVNDSSFSEASPTPPAVGAASR